MKCEFKSEARRMSFCELHILRCALYYILRTNIKLARICRPDGTDDAVMPIYIRLKKAQIRTAVVN